MGTENSNKDTSNGNTNTALQEDDASQHAHNPPKKKELRSGTEPVDVDAETTKLKGQDWQK